ncbi:hypothetical protein DERF_008493 [Dermatophagoides farinae]|uniref:Uncharacterized protein n=1 Tax=Dermatophagoides farinae TaxID=6954 RepID=A0A922I2J2_DERFA|nr:hypothetical protein DERF_008493 [Dermatophagoides farinae]
MEMYKMSDSSCRLRTTSSVIKIFTADGPIIQNLLRYVHFGFVEFEDNIVAINFDCSSLTMDNFDLILFQCNALYNRIPSVRPQICMRSSLDNIKKSKPEKFSNIDR